MQYNLAYFVTSNRSYPWSTSFKAMNYHKKQQTKNLPLPYCISNSRNLLAFGTKSAVPNGIEPEV